MSLEDLIKPFPWTEYSKKIGERIKKPMSCGFYTREDAELREMFLAEGSSGKAEDGNAITLYLLVDETDGMIVDARFQAFGHTALIAASEALCLLVIGKHILQSRRIGTDLIDKRLRDAAEVPAFPFDAMHHLNLVLEALDAAIETCGHIAAEEKYETPLMTDFNSQGGYPGWQELSQEKKKAMIEKILAEEIRPYIELDAGGVELFDVIGDREVIISYQGSCTSCFSAVGTTLSSIQQILQAKVFSEIRVTPNMDSLKF